MNPAYLRNEKILIIEADEAFGTSVRDTLKNDGYENTFLVKNGEEGLKAIYDNLPHLILVDITLPGLDGYDLLAKKQAEPLLTKIPVFLMSTQGVPINMRRVPQGSVAEFIISFHADPSEILNKVNVHFGHEKLNVAPASDKKKVLWVEDDKLIGTILAKKIISSGFDLFHAKNGEEAMNALHESRPDVIVLDLMLPGMSGFDILQSIKSDQNFKSIPVMILSNLSKQDDILKAQNLGASKFLVKAAASLEQIIEEMNRLTGA